MKIKTFQRLGKNTKKTTEMLGKEFLKAGLLLMIIILPIAFFLNNPELAWSFMFPIVIGFVFYSTSQ